jgi:hypothetical protein
VTNEEFERLKDQIRAQQRRSHQSNAEDATASLKSAEERRKRDRDLDRLERALKKIVEAPLKSDKHLREDKYWREFREHCEKREAEIKEIKARYDAKINAMIDEMPRRASRSPSDSGA